jgi:hypothetical protein
MFIDWTNSLNRKVAALIRLFLASSPGQMNDGFRAEGNNSDDGRECDDEIEDDEYF